MSIIKSIRNKITGSVAQDSFAGDTNDTVLQDGLCEAARLLANEGIILLKNGGGVLPLDKLKSVSIFGRVQFDYFCVGYGSGGDVNSPYRISLAQALKESDYTFDKDTFSEYEKWISENPIPKNKMWGNWPLSYEEMPVTDEFVKTASEKSETAVAIIGRAAGEDRDNELKKGSFYLSEKEELLIKTLNRFFKNIVVVFNIGNPMDFGWTENYENIKSIVYAPHAGMDGGRVLKDALWGEFNPSGKLSDTIAKKFEDYPASADFGSSDFNNYTEDIYVGYRYFETFCPEKVLYPFGFGLSYTSFEIKANASEKNGEININATVKNTGKVSGKEVVQIYFEAPQGVLGKPLKQLVAFGKTKLLSPDEEETISLSFDISEMASFDDAGKTGNKACFVLEQGEYKIFAGNSVKACEQIFSFKLDENKVTKQCENACAVKNVFEIIKPELRNGKYEISKEKVGISDVNLKQRISERSPKEIKFTGDKGYKLSDVKSGKISMNDFVAQLTPKELDVLCRGGIKMNSPFGSKGNAGAFGGTTESLRAKGIDAAITTDGPSGIRLAANTTLIPTGVSIASSWNGALLTEVTSLLAKEMIMKGSEVLLAPGINIHRNHLCGRNFEYYSEDPVLAGKIASSYVKGIQSKGVSACPKHFACNNQEKGRNLTDSRVSERALREIYLKPFEICVKTATPKTIMTSYNKINSVYSHYNYDLCTTILRNEWKFNGMVMTDWWMKSDESPDFENCSVSGYRVKAQVDVLMPGSKFVNRASADKTALKSYKKGGLSLAEMQRSAINVLKFILDK